MYILSYIIEALEDILSALAISFSLCSDPLDDLKKSKLLVKNCLVKITFYLGHP